MLNERQNQPTTPRAVVLIGLESTGKSALFRSLSGMDTGAESNFRGSTVTVRRTDMIIPTSQSSVELVDTPGIRVQDDSLTTELALNMLGQSDIVLLIVRATHAARELPLLLKMLDLIGKNIVLILTFADRASTLVEAYTTHYRQMLGISVLAVDSRQLDITTRGTLLQAIDMARPMKRKPVLTEPPVEEIKEAQITWFEHTTWGRTVSVIALLLLFAVPVFLAYVLSGWLQPLADHWLLDPLRNLTLQLPDWLKTMLLGSYGVLSLGIYSFIWAFPVVLFVGLSVALTEESGLKDRITDSLDGWMRRIGLNGRDLIPVLSGFGCNVVAVFQSRTCSRCTRRACVSLIAFGSACSYQIGASLSIFSSGGRPWLFLPYLLILVLVGATHTRLWNRQSSNLQSVVVGRTFLQWPSLRAVRWRLHAVLKQFLTQAMPIFLLICVGASLLQWSGILDRLTKGIAPLLSLFGLPHQATAGILFSILRKDGLLVLNQDGGQWLVQLSGGQLLVLVYLASTLTACLVTLWTISRELGVGFALKLAGRQLLTSLISTWLIAVIVIA
ncbi:FeoB small GTPase domain-containing protein [Paenibacillus hunanensis]|uniref:nucleoside recognition domain-containing protein n=1 Tax=Paenibacillus hunanensis TaxID=539262 RepID=UPI002A6A651F|nr:nucleoside recognition domain-containing protein [Paenibacillus hunanensis]WPP43474.1 FeoB small GTPase domain-containing protein [Paenibacillus hunanensis]